MRSGASRVTMVEKLILLLHQRFLCVGRRMENAVLPEAPDCSHVWQVRPNTDSEMKACGQPIY